MWNTSQTLTPNDVSLEMKPPPPNISPRKKLRYKSRSQIIRTKPIPNESPHHHIPTHYYTPPPPHPLLPPPQSSFHLPSYLPLPPPLTIQAPNVLYPFHPHPHTPLYTSSFPPLPHYQSLYHPSSLPLPLPTYTTLNSTYPIPVFRTDIAPFYSSIALL